jgi:chromosome segregation ATPase
MKKNLKKLSEVAKAPDLDASSDGGVYLTEEQHANITATLEANEAAISKHAADLKTAQDNLQVATDANAKAIQNAKDLQATLTAKETELADKVTALDQATKTITAKDTDIATLQEDKAELQAKISGKPYKRLGATSANGGATPPAKKLRSVELASQQID